MPQLNFNFLAQKIIYCLLCGCLSLYNWYLVLLEIVLLLHSSSKLSKSRRLPATRALHETVVNSILISLMLAPCSIFHSVCVCACVCAFMFMCVRERGRQHNRGDIQQIKLAFYACLIMRHAWNANFIYCVSVCCTSWMCYYFYSWWYSGQFCSGHLTSCLWVGKESIYHCTCFTLAKMYKYILQVCL